MAIRPDYMVGTITLTSGSKNFTTAGASLQSANVTGGDTIMTADGRVLIIDKVTGQNAGTLRNNSPISASNVALVIRYQPDGSKYQGAMRDLLERWGLTGNIDAIAGLETAKDMLAYFTGAGTADTTALTEWARGFLSAVDGAKGYGKLGEVPNNQLPFRLRNIGELVSDADNAVNNGFYRVNSSTLNLPAGATTGLLLVNSYSATGGVQTLYDVNSRVEYFRTQASGTYSEWLRQWNSRNLLTTVSQTAGVPTGGIIQRGNNANGEFVRFADGTQIVHHVINLDVAIDQTWGSGFMSDSISGGFPVAFVSLPAVSITNNLQSIMNVQAGTSTYGFRLWSSLLRLVESRRVTVMAIGRWF